MFFKFLNGSEWNKKGIHLWKCDDHGGISIITLIYKMILNGREQNAKTDRHLMFICRNHSGHITVKYSQISYFSNIHMTHNTVQNFYNVKCENIPLLKYFSTIAMIYKQDI
jgi:hypothetical protein